MFQKLKRILKEKTLPLILAVSIVVGTVITPSLDGFSVFAAESNELDNNSSVTSGDTMTDIPSETVDETGSLDSSETDSSVTEPQEEKNEDMSTVTEDEESDTEDVKEDVSDSDTKTDGEKTDSSNAENIEDDTTGSGTEEVTEKPEKDSVTEETEESENVEISTEIEPETEEPEEEITLSYEDTENQMLISVSGKKSDFGNAVSVVAVAATESRVEAYNQAFSESEDTDNYQAVAVYDIRLLDASGHSVEPNGTVSVTFQSTEVKDVLDASVEDETVEMVILHNLDTVAEVVDSESVETEDIEETVSEVSESTEKEAQSEQTQTIESEDTEEISSEQTDNSETKDQDADTSVAEEGTDTDTAAEETVIPNEVLKEMVEPDAFSDVPVNIASLETIETVSAEGDTVVFETNAFSEYALVLTGNDSQKEVDFQDGGYLELDKYLEDTGVVVNNQKSYDLYLEQAYYSNEKRQHYAPTSVYSYLIFDQSNSHGDDVLVRWMNAGIKEYLYKVVDINQERMSLAESGEYVDIDPNSPTWEEDMKDHLFYISGSIGYHWYVMPKEYQGRENFDVAPMTYAEADELIEVFLLENDFDQFFNDNAEPVDFWTDVGGMERTSLAFDYANQFLQDHPHYGTIHHEDGSTEQKLVDQVVFVSDGRPDWEPDPFNKALTAAQPIKDRGIKIFTICQWAGLDGSNPWLVPALENKDINLLDLPFDTEHLFMSLISSDSPAGATTVFNNTGHVETMYYGEITSFTRYDDEDNTFGKYALYPSEKTAEAYCKTMINTAINQDTESVSVDITYAGGSAEIRDSISDAFDITDPAQVSVYAVPYVPENIGEDGIPTDMVRDESDPMYGHVSSLRWGIDSTSEDETEEDNSEWIDITNKVNISISGNLVSISGWNYEIYSVRDYDKDIYSPYEENPLVYEPGDYGYKIVVRIPVNANYVFGGNHVATNNIVTSAFYPSDPTENIGVPKWKNNSELNPDGNQYIDKYPVPYVDFNISYKTVSDNMVVYAPQTADMLNLVTDSDNFIFYVDDYYWDLLEDYNLKNDEYEEALDDYNETISTDIRVLQQLQEAVNNAQDELLAAKALLDDCESYIPDGLNNAFVNLTYTLKDPDGQVVGTLNVPHGQAYVSDRNDNTDGNIKWSFTQDKIIKSGVYTITCTVSPCDTVMSPTGHVSTKADPDSSGSIYDSESYSSTGSLAAGSVPATDVVLDPSAYLYQLKVYTGDTRLVKNQTLDFNLGVEDLMKTENPHILGYEWVCTDGVTESIAENEPGITGLMTVGFGVTVTSQIPVQAEQEGRVADVAGITVVNVDDGDYVPVSVILNRSVGDLNKSTDPVIAGNQTTVYMTDTDQIWGSLSSVIWEHECGIITDYNCEDEDFAEAQRYNTAENDTGRGQVQYLIHVLNNPLPDVTKSTSAPNITRGGDIQWSVSAVNNEAATNPNHRSSEFSLIDILPYNNDGRIDPNTNIESSKFSGTLMYKSITLDLTGSPTAKDLYQNGRSVFYYTTSTAVRTASENDLMGSGTDNCLNWTAASGSLNGNEVSFSVPSNATAVRFDTTLLWNESVDMDMTANLQNIANQQIGDRYHNEACVVNQSGIRNSNVVATTVTSLYVSGTVWEDGDANGLMSGDETKLEDIVITLYIPYDSKNGGTPDRTIGGIQLTRAYDANGDKFAPYATLADGTYAFDDIPIGTYYIVADYIPDQYEMTRKQAGAGDPTTAILDSEAEASFADTTSDTANTAWIKSVKVSNAGVQNLNIGVQLIKGSVTIGKILDEIFYPASMTDEEKEDYRVGFIFELKNRSTGRVYSKAIYLDETNCHLSQGHVQVLAKFEDLPVGIYELTEASDSQYELSNVTAMNESPAINFNSNTKVTTIQITSVNRDFEVLAENELYRDPPGGDKNGVDNYIGMRVPVDLEVIYSGSDTISSDTLTQYTFKQSDFEDIIVTYDDGTTSSLKEGTLRFDQVTLNPSTVTNNMNSGGDKIAVTVYYTEKGRFLTDSFRVAVDLKPVHKFYLNFNANGSTFNDGNATNSVWFGYDEISGSNYVISGTYKDVPNGGMRGLSNFTFAGWNTENDGSGEQYDSFTALNAVGRDSGVTSLTLYANWTTYVTFNANGGTITKGTTAQETALRGKTSGNITVSRNQMIGTTLEAEKSGYDFVLWNTKPDGSGTNLENYGRVTGPVTFYAVYIKERYNYVGHAETFVAPTDGVYELTVYGASGGSGSGTPGGRGGLSKGRIHLSAGETITVYVGGAGGQGSYGWGYSSGGETQGGGGGGGSTELHYRNSRLIVAGGGGGGAEITTVSPVGGNGGGANMAGGAGAGDRVVNAPRTHDDTSCSGGSGGTLSSSGAGGTKTSGRSSCTAGESGGAGTVTKGGIGARYINDDRKAKSRKGGGGGGGYYAGGGGATASTFTYADMSSGDSDPTGYYWCAGGGGGGSGYANTSLLSNVLGQSGVNSGNGYATIVLISRD